jgi:hypothetical protein
VTYGEGEAAHGDGREAEQDEHDFVRGDEECEREAGQAERADEGVREQRACGGCNLNRHDDHRRHFGVVFVRSAVV